MAEHVAGVWTPVTVIAQVNGWTHCPHIGCGWNYVGDPVKAAPSRDAHLRLMHAGKHPDGKTVE